VLITVIPNMLGVVGAIERLINPAVYSMHVRLSPRALAAAHEQVGLAQVQARYFMSTNFGVANVNGLDEHARSTRAKAALLRNLSRLSKIVWAFEDGVRLLPPTQLLSPYVVCVARRA
jgi:hypothetical protein